MNRTPMSSWGSTLGHQGSWTSYGLEGGGSFFILNKKLKISVLLCVNQDCRTEGSCKVQAIK